VLRALPALVVILAFLSAGCRSCERTPAIVARLAELHGKASRAADTKGGSWDDAAPGASFAIGDALRTQASSTAKIDLESGGALRLSQNTLVRFLSRAAKGGSRPIGVETGEAEIESGPSGLAIETSMGPAQVEPGSRVLVIAGRGEARFEVMLGRAEIDTDGGVAKTLEAGQGLTVGTGAAVVEPPATSGGDAATDAIAPPPADASVPTTIQAEVRGDGVESARPKGALSALPAGPAVSIAEGSRLVVPDGASVVLTRGAERAVVVGRADVTIGHLGAELLETRTGRVMLASPTPGSRIDVPGGSIVLMAAGAGGVQAQVTVDRRTARVVSNQSQLELRGRAGTAVVGAGETGTLDVTGAAATESSSPSVADLTVPAGESSVVHSLRGKAAVRIRLDGVCGGDAVVEWISGAANRTTFVHGQNGPAAILPLGSGPHKYAVRCVDPSGLRGPSQTSGTISVARDGGEAPLPRTAPMDSIDADGRRYSVLYQTLLPQISFRWPRAPAGRPLSLHIERGKGQMETVSAPSGSVALPAGKLPEGSYDFWFDVDGDASNRSPDTTLRIAFDNAAPAAEIQQPADGQASAGTVHVAGVAVEGASVSVDGAAIALDQDYRFRADVPAPSGDKALAIRISHPSRGVHYYLRVIGVP